jgi:hypothetical protein
MQEKLPFEDYTKGLQNPGGVTKIYSLTHNREFHQMYKIYSKLKPGVIATRPDRQSAINFMREYAVISGLGESNLYFIKDREK